MMDALLATLEREADAEVTRVLDEARTRAAELTAAAEQRMAARRALTLGRREAEARADEERALSAARRAAQAQVLAARAETLDRVFAAVRAELPALGKSPAYRAQVGAHLEHVLRFAGDQPVTVQCSPAVSNALRATVKTNGRLRIESDRRIAAGFRIATMDGVLEVDATLESRLERLRPRLALEAVAALSP
jgi:vacuolar-type H+-ATPase subunit E/Vma4